LPAHIHFTLNPVKRRCETRIALDRFAPSPFSHAAADLLDPGVGFARDLTGNKYHRSDERDGDNEDGNRGGDPFAFDVTLNPFMQRVLDDGERERPREPRREGQRQSVADVEDGWR